MNITYRKEFLGNLEKRMPGSIPNDNHALCFHKNWTDLSNKAMDHSTRIHEASCNKNTVYSFGD